MKQKHLILTDDPGYVFDRLHRMHAYPLDRAKREWTLGMRVPRQVTIDDAPLPIDGTVSMRDFDAITADMHIYVRRPIDLLNHKLTGLAFDAVIAERIDYTALRNIHVRAQEEIFKAVHHLIRGNEKRMIGRVI